MMFLFQRSIRISHKTAQALLFCTYVCFKGKEDLPKHFTNPIMRIQKLENLQMCLQMLQEKGLSLKGIHADGKLGRIMPVREVPLLLRYWAQTPLRL